MAAKPCNTTCQLILGAVFTFPIVLGIIDKLRQKTQQSEKYEEEIRDLTLAFGATKSAKEVLSDLLNASIELGIDVQDMYGNSRPEGGHWLHDFEAKVARDLGKQAGLFVPSGTMAQQMVLKISQKKKQRNSFIAHPTSHLLRWEQGAHDELCNMPVNMVGDPTRPFIASDLKSAEQADTASCVILEVPHREIGGEITPWSDIQEMKRFCQEKDIWFHMDGARLWEALPYYAEHDGLSSAEVCAAFDSIYASFYKGLGGMCGAMLLGDNEFIEEARIWLRRFGGNLFTALPYAVADLKAYNEMRHSFTDRAAKARQIVEVVKNCAKYDEVCFTPPIPQCSLVHCHLKGSSEHVTTAKNAVEKQLGVRVFRQIRGSYLPDHVYFEWNFGPVNMDIPLEVYTTAWSLFFTELANLQHR